MAQQQPQPRLGIQALGLAAAMLLSACSGAPPTPGAAQSSTGPAAPSPVTSAEAPSTGAALSAPPSAPPTVAPDVAALFAKQMASPQLDLAGEVTGSMSLGNLAGDISGVMATKGDDSAMKLTIDIPDILETSTYQITYDGHRYESKDGGPFFEVPLPADDDRFGTTLATAAADAKDVGIVTKDGEQLHHLVAANGSSITAADLGMTDPSMTDASGTLDFYVRDDGSLAVVEVALSWQVDTDGQTIPASMAMDFTFLGGDVGLIDRPASVWATFTSKQHGYTMGYPEDMRVIAAKKASDADIFAYSATQLTTAMRERQPKAASGNLGAYTRAFIAATPCKLEINDRGSLAGREVHVVACHRKVNGEKLYFVWTLFIEGRNGYQVASVGPTGYEEEIRAFNEAQVMTITLP